MNNKIVRYSFLTFLFFQCYFLTSQALLPTGSGFDGLTFPEIGWEANSPQYYTGMGNPAPAYKFDNTGKHITIHFLHSPDSVFFELRSNAVQSPESLFKVQESIDGDVYDDVVEFGASILPSLNTFTPQKAKLSSQSRYVRFIYAQKGSPNGGNVGLDNVLITPLEVSEQQIGVKIGNEFVSPLTTHAIGAPLDESATLPFSIFNLGNLNDLTVSALTFDGPDAEEFSIDGSLSFPLTISALSSFDIGIEFTPESEGQKEATVTIFSDDNDIPEFTINLLGFGDEFEVEPEDQPTNLTFTGIKTYRFHGSFSASNADGFLVLKKSNPITEIPQDGQAYTPGDVIGDAKVVQSSASVNFTPKEVAAQSTYYFAVFAYNGEGLFRNYKTDEPLTGSVQTPETMAWPNEYVNVSITSPNFVQQLHDNISPHTQHSYGTYQSKLIDKFYERDTIGGQKALTCLYTGEVHMYTPPFSYNVVGFSREHTYPYSWFPLDDNTANYYSDYHNLFPIHQNRANGVRSNYPLGVVEGDIIEQYGEGILGRNDEGRIVYEPKDSHKGDAARAILYMCIRYTENGILWKLPEYISYSVAYGQNQTVLKEWNLQDPPSSIEIARNDLIDSLQGNRNPFIDHPEYACYIDFHTMEYLSYGCENLKTPTEELTAILVYPNPIRNSFTLSSNGIPMEEYQIFDLTGRLIQHGSLENTTFQKIEITHLKSGNYFLYIKTNQGEVRKKIMVF